MPTHLVTREKARKITEQVEAAVASIFEQHGMEAPKVKTTYGDRYAVKLESTPFEEGEGGINLNSAEAQSYKLEAQYNDELDPAALGREFTVNGETFIFAGHVHKRPKYPYVANRKSDGRTFKFTRDIERFLKHERL